MANTTLLKPILSLLKKRFPGLSAGIDKAIDDYSGSEDFDKAEDYLSQMEGSYRSAQNRVRGQFQDSPQIDLQGYIDQLGEYSGDMLDDYLSSAGQIEGTSKKALSEVLGSYDSAMNIFKEMAGSEMPGYDQMRGQIGAQTQAGMSQLRDVGGLNASTFAQMLTGETKGLRELGMQSSAYKQNTQNALANAYAQMGTMQQSAYTNRMQALQSAAGLRGAGYQGASNMTGMQAGLAQNQFQYNQMMPWQMETQYHMGQVAQNNPYQAGMQFHGQKGAYDDARRDALFQGFINYGQNARDDAEGVFTAMLGNPEAFMNAGGGGESYNDEGNQVFNKTKDWFKI